jgi:hypothetical protein
MEIFRPDSRFHDQRSDFCRTGVSILISFLTSTFFRDRLTNVEEVNEQVVDVIVESAPSPSLPTSSQASVAESEAIPSTPSTNQARKTPRLSKKRQNNNSMDEELTQALIQSLGTSSVTTPLGQSVSNLEQKLEQRGLDRVKLAFIRKINSLVMETEEEILDL